MTFMQNYHPKRFEVGLNAPASGGKHFADATNGFALGFAESKELETVAQALTIADDGADFQRIRTEGQRNIERYNLAGFQFAGERGADAILTHFSGASPTGAEFAALKHADLQTGIDDKAGVTANVGRGGRRGSTFLAGSCHSLNLPSGCFRG